MAEKELAGMFCLPNEAIVQIIGGVVIGYQAGGGS